MSRLTCALVASFVLGSSSCGGGTKRRSQIADLTPASIEATPTGGDTKPFRVRIYADDAYRAQRINWERDATALLRRANKVLGPTAGIELTLVQSTSWARKSKPLDTAAMLAELEDVDPGGDVHLVIGMVDALPEVTTQIHQLGIARPMGKHLIIRGLNDAKEVAVLEAARQGYQAKRRQELYAKRGRHKMTVVFLHEVAHVLGAIHVTEDEDILSPGYSHTQKEFSKPNATLMRIAASFRLEAEVGESRRAEFEAVLAHIKSTTYPAWHPGNKSELVTYLEQRITAEASPRTELSALGRAVRADHRKGFREAIRLADAGKPLEAWEKAEPLMDFYPDEPAVAVLGCRLASAVGRAEPEVTRLCERASVLAPGDLTPTLKIAMAATRAGDHEAALAALAKARARLTTLDGEHDESWQQLAAAYKQLGMVSLAAEAATRSKSATGEAAWAKRERAKYSVPAVGDKRRGKRFAPELDARYIADLKAALKLVYARNFGDAEKAVAAARKTYGATAGFDTVRCDLEIRRRNYPRALGHCKRAHGKFPDGSWTNYLLGLLHKQGKRKKDAIVHLRRAIELDPDQKHPYQILAGLYTETGQPAERVVLEAAYKKRFNAPLP